MGRGHGAGDNLLSLTMKLTGSMQYKQRLTADQSIFHKMWIKNGTLGLSRNL